MMRAAILRKITGLVCQLRLYSKSKRKRGEGAEGKEGVGGRERRRAGEEEHTPWKSLVRFHRPI
jgi:hypothetical protein